jgi:hypothetical protein
MKLPDPDSGTLFLRGLRVGLDTEVGREFISDCARHTERLIPDADMKAKWGLTDQDWAALADNGPLLRAVRSERQRRVVTGQTAREAASQFYAQAPNVLGDILTDGSVSPRHRIEAAKELRAVATAGERSDRRPERFTVTINLGDGDKRVIELDGTRRDISPFDGEAN